MMRHGFSFPELLLIIGVFMLLMAIALPSFNFFKKRSALEDSAEELKSALVLAQSKATATQGTQEYGVFFDNISVPQRYVIFKGSSYASRDVNSDQVYELPDGIEFATIDFQSSKEVVFSRLTGQPNNPGFVVVRLSSDPGNTRSVFVEPSGVIELGPQSLVSDAERIKDSRHVHFVYTRTIDTSTENIDLVFTGDTGPVTETIIIANALEGGNIEWTGEVLVDGEIQKIELRTHRLNDPDTEFSIIRDRRYNNKTLEITISGDTTGNLIRYATNGQTIAGTSIYVQEPIWQ